MKQYIRYLQVLYRYNSQGKKHNKKKKNVRKCHVNSLARIESACVLREGLMSFMYDTRLVDQAIKLASTFPQNFEKVFSLFCCCHALFQGVS